MKTILPQLPWGEHVDHDEADNQDGHADQEIQDGGDDAFDDRIEVDGSQLERQVHGISFMSASGEMSFGPAWSTGAAA